MITEAGMYMGMETSIIQYLSHILQALGIQKSLLMFL